MERYDSYKQLIKDLSENINCDNLSLIKEMLETIINLDAALYYVGNYGRTFDRSYNYNEEELRKNLFHVQEVARENVECEVNYLQYVEDLDGYKNIVKNRRG